MVCAWWPEDAKPIQKLGTVTNTSFFFFSFKKNHEIPSGTKSESCTLNAKNSHKTATVCPIAPFEFYI